jgi:hypothetical protein
VDSIKADEAKSAELKAAVAEKDAACKHRKGSVCSAVESSHQLPTDINEFRCELCTSLSWSVVKRLRESGDVFKKKKRGETNGC